MLNDDNDSDNQTAQLVCFDSPRNVSSVAVFAACAVGRVRAICITQKTNIWMLQRISRVNDTEIVYVSNYN